MKFLIEVNIIFCVGPVSPMVKTVAGHFGHGHFGYDVSIRVRVRAKKIRDPNAHSRNVWAETSTAERSDIRSKLTHSTYFDICAYLKFISPIEFIPAACRVAPCYLLYSRVEHDEKASFFVIYKFKSLKATQV